MYCWQCVHTALKEQDEIFEKEKNLSLKHSGMRILAAKDI